MKKVILLILVLALTIFAVGCGEDAPESTAEENTVSENITSENITSENVTTVKETTSAKADLTLDYLIDSVGKKVTIGQTSEKSAEMIGAKEGIGFFVGDKSFEIYRFDDETKINEAKTGIFKLTIEGFGEFEYNSVVNENFVMIYKEADEAVINAFKEVK